jgi:hypothetical protein
MVRILTITCAFVLLADIAAAQCLRANTDSQIAEGRLAIERARDAAGREERPFILHLPTPACLDGPDPDDKVKSTRTIHVFSFDTAILASMRRLVGKTVRVRGNPFAAHTAHHHAPIVMQISEVGAR